MRTYKNKSGYVAIEWVIIASIMLLFGFTILPNAVEKEKEVYEVVDTNNNKIVYEEIAPETDIFFDTSSGESIHKEFKEENEIPIKPKPSGGSLDDGLAHVKEIILSVNSLTMDTGQIEQVEYELVPTIEGQEIVYDDVEWTSSNERVVQTLGFGRVKAIGPGSAQVCATSLDVGAPKACLTVSVNYIPSTDLVPNVEELVLNEGEFFQVTAKVYPSNAAGQEIFYHIEDDRVATVNEKGMVTASSNVSYNNYTTTLIVSNYDLEVRIPITVIDVDFIETTRVKGHLFSDVYLDTSVDEYLLESEVLPSDATNKELYYYSQDTNVVEVIGSGPYIKPTGAGETVVEVCNNGASFYGEDVCDWVNVYVEEALIYPEAMILYTKNNVTEINAGDRIEIFKKWNPDETTVPFDDGYWTTSNESIATVNDAGIVTAENPGTVQINYIVNQFENSKGVHGPYTGTFELTVKDRPVAPTSIKSTPVKDTLLIGESTTISTIFTPSNTNLKGLNYISTNTAVATVNSEGVVTAIGSGEVNIIVQSSSDPSVIYTVNMTVTGVNVDNVVWEMNANEDGQKILTIPPGKNYPLTYKVNPNDATDKNVTIVSSDPDMVWYDNNVKAIVVAANASGSADITIYASRAGVYDMVTVKIGYPVPDSVVLTQDEIELEQGDVINLQSIIDVVPVYAKRDFEYVFDSNTTIRKTIGQKQVCDDNGENCVLEKYVYDEEVSVAEIDSTGQLVGLNPGTAILKIYLKDKPDVYMYLNITVKIVDVQSVVVALNDETIIDGLKNTTSMGAYVYPENATNQEILYYSSDDSIASIDTLGVITALDFGEVDIYAVAHDGIVYNDDGSVNFESSKSKKIHVTVIDSTVYAESIEHVGEESLTLYTSQTHQFSATVLPENTTNKALEWESSDSAVLTIDKNTGIATAISNGKVTVTGYTSNGLSISYEVRVKRQDITKFIVTPSKLILGVNGTAMYNVDSLPQSLTSGDYEVRVLDKDGYESDVVSVNKSTFMITAKKEGTAYIHFDVPDLEVTNYEDASTIIEVIVKNNSELWDGTTKTSPTVENNTYIINKASDFAYLMTNTLRYDNIELRTNIDFNGYNIIPLGKNQTGLMLSLEGNGYTISNGVINDNSETIGLISVLNGSVKNLTLEDITLNTSGNSSNAGVLAGTISNAVVENVKVKNCSININEDVDMNVGFVAGYADDKGQNVNIHNLLIHDTEVNILNESQNVDFGMLIAETKQNINVDTFDIRRNNYMSSDRFGMIIGSVIAGNVNLKNFAMVNEGALSNALFGNAANSSSIDMENYVVDHNINSIMEEQRLFVQTGTPSISSINGYYVGDGAKELIEGVTVIGGLTRKDSKKDIISVEFVQTLNINANKEWMYIDDSYPMISELANKELVIDLDNNKLVIFKAITQNAPIDTSFTSSPYILEPETIECYSEDTNVVMVDKNTCVANAGNASGAAYIQVVMNGKYSDRVKVVSYALTNEYGDPASLTDDINQALVRDSLEGLIEYENPTEDTWIAKIK